MNSTAKPPAHAEAKGVTLAALQMCSGDSVEENLGRASALIEAAAAAGAEIIGLPENFSFMGTEAQKLVHAEPLDGPTLSHLAALCARLQVSIVAGTIPLVCEDPKRVYAASVYLDFRGQQLAVYKKIHLFDVDLPQGEHYRESEIIQAGQEPRCLEASVASAPERTLRQGLSVCYDLRFPELYRALARAGADLIWSPAAFTYTTGKDHWRVLLRARAIENGLYVAAPAQVGTHPTGRRTYGHALICDPWGEVLDEVQAEGEGFAIATLRPSRLAEVRSQLPTHRHHVLAP